MPEALPDGGDEEEDAPEWAVTWKKIGRELLRIELTDHRVELRSAFYDAEEALQNGDELTHEHVHALRLALNDARERVENQLAPAAGGEPWGRPSPRIPSGVLWEWTNHPKAEGVDPREYVEDLEDDNE
jgi:hypothetical protein